MFGQQIRNGPRRLLSQTGGRLPALKRAVSKPDAEAEREQHPSMRHAYICQDLVAKSPQYCGSDVSQLLCGYLTRDKLPLTLSAVSSNLETIKTKTRDRCCHVAFGPHFGRGKGMGQGLRKFDLDVIGHWRSGRRRAERYYRHNIATPPQSWYDDYHGPAFDHFGHDKTAKIAKQDFAKFRVIHQGHRQTTSDAIATLKGPGQ